MTDAQARDGGDPIDPLDTLLRRQRQPLRALFSPGCVAVIGASERPGSLGRGLLWNLIRSPFGGTVYPVHSSRHSVLGVRCCPTLAAVPEPVDLALIATPAAAVPAQLAACAAAGVKAAIVLSGGFREVGAEGLALENELRAILRGSGLRLLGPNCLGLMNPRLGLNASSATRLAAPGHVGFLSQSRAVATAMLDWSHQQGVGFSAVVSIGSMLDVGWGDLITVLGDDPATRSIVIHMETVGDARSFVSAAREVALSKPIVLIRGGRSPEAARAAALHTGAPAGSDAVLEAALRRCGVLRVDRLSDLFDLADVLAREPRRPSGPRLAIVTNAGGPGVLATDALVRSGGQLAALAPASLAALEAVLPPHWSRANPIDLLGDADPERYARAAEIALADPGCDGLLAILTPLAMSDPTTTAQRLRELAGRSGKPLLASWMGGEEVAAGVAILKGAGIATNPHPDAAARLFSSLWRFSYTLRGLYETPALLPESDGQAGPAADHDAGAMVLAQAQAAGRAWLSRQEARQLLASYGIPVPDPGEALAPAGSGPGVQEGVLELRLDSRVDAQFGPVILFGCGGALAEVVDDSAVGLPPLNTTLARRLLEQTRVYGALQGRGGGPAADLEELERLLVRLSQLVLEQPAILEITIDPLLVRPGDRRRPLLALEARIRIQAVAGATCHLPRPAIRPYPSQYVRPWRLRDGTPVTIRPIRPEDEPLLVTFHRSLSQESVYTRYFHLTSLSHRIAHERLVRICFSDYERELALVVDRRDPASGEHQLLAVGRLSRLHERNDAEFSMLIGDAHQHQGLGTALLGQLLRAGRDEGIERVTAEILRQNGAMQRVCRRLGFQFQPGDELIEAWIDLATAVLPGDPDSGDQAASSASTWAAAPPASPLSP